MPSIVKEDDKSAVVQRDDGSKVTIAKTPGNAKVLDAMRTDSDGVPAKYANAPSLMDVGKTALKGAANLYNLATMGEPLEQPPAQEQQPSQASPAPAASEQPAPQPSGAPAQPAPAPSSPTPQPGSPEVGQVGLGMIGQGFEKQQKALEQQQQAVQDQYNAGKALASAQIGQIERYEQKARDDERTLITDAALRKQALDQAMTQVNQAKQDYLQHGAVNPQRLWNNMNLWQKGLAGISILLGGISTDPNHVNQGMKAINDAIEMDVKAQQNRQDQLKSAFDMSQQGFEDLRQHFQDETQNYLFHKSLRLDSYNLALQKIAAQNQGTELAARAKALSAQLQDASGQLQRQYGEVLLSTIPSVKDIKPEQWNAATHANSMLQAENTLQELAKKGYTGTEATRASIPGLPDRLKPDVVKQFEQAQNQFALAKLNFEGKRANPEIIEMTKKELFPAPGASRQAIQKAREARQQVIMNARGQAGPALRLMPLLPAQQTPTGFTPVSGR